MPADQLHRILGTPPTHLGYVVDDLPSAVESWVGMGVGPFFLLERPHFDVVESNGEPGVFEVSAAAFTWWGNLGVEVGEYVDLQPGDAAERMKLGKGPVLNHVGYESATPTEDSARLEEMGIPLFLQSRLGDLEERLHYAPALGHAIQIHPEGALADFWLMLREASEGWNGDEPLRPFVPGESTQAL